MYDFKGEGSQQNTYDTHAHPMVCACLNMIMLKIMRTSDKCTNPNEWPTMPDPNLVQTRDVCRILAFGIVAYAFFKFEHPVADSLPQDFIQMQHIVARSTPFGRTDDQQKINGDESSVAK